LQASATNSPESPYPGRVTSSFSNIADIGAGMIHVSESLQRRVTLCRAAVRAEHAAKFRFEVGTAQWIVDMSLRMLDLGCEPAYGVGPAQLSSAI